MAKVDVKVPDIGDFKDVPVIEVLVKPGDVVKAEQSLITLESDKATMDVPSPVAGKVAEVVAKVGDKVSMGDADRAHRVREGGDGAGFRLAAKAAARPPALSERAAPPRRPRAHPEGRRAGAREGGGRSTSQCPTSATSTTCRSSRFW